MRSARAAGESNGRGERSSSNSAIGRLSSERTNVVHNVTSVNNFHAAIGGRRSAGASPRRAEAPRAGATDPAPAGRHSGAGAPRTATQGRSGPRLPFKEQGPLSRGVESRKGAGRGGLRLGQSLRFP